MKKSKKVISYILVIMFFLLIVVTDNKVAYAANKKIKAETIIVDEMSYISWLINSTDEELLENGYTEEDIYEIRNYNYSEDILSLQGFSRDELNKMGYDDNQVQSIYKYDGKEDAVQYAKSLNISSAKLTITYYVKQLVARKSVEICYKTQWNMCPIFTEIDCLAIAWTCNDVNSKPISTMIMYEEHNADYYSLLGGELHHYEGVKVSGNYNYRLLDVDMISDVTIKWNSDVYEEFYAKNIWGCIGIKTASGSYNLNNIIVTLGYSHTILGSSANIGVDITGNGSIGLSFSWRAEELYNDTRIFKYNGSVSY